MGIRPSATPPDRCVNKSVNSSDRITDTGALAREQQGSLHVLQDHQANLAAQIKKLRGTLEEQIASLESSGTGAGDGHLEAELGDACLEADLDPDRELTLRCTQEEDNREEHQ